MMDLSHKLSTVAQGNPYDNLLLCLLCTSPDIHGPPSPLHYLELPAVPAPVEDCSRLLLSPPVIIGRHSPMLMWRLGNSRHCSRALLEFTCCSGLGPSTAASHAVLTSTSGNGPERSASCSSRGSSGSGASSVHPAFRGAGLRMRCLDGNGLVQVVPGDRADGGAGDSGGGAWAPPRCLARGETAWLSAGDTVVVDGHVRLAVVPLLLFTSEQCSYSSVTRAEVRGHVVCRALLGRGTRSWRAMEKASRAELVTAAHQLYCREQGESQRTAATATSAASAAAPPPATAAGSSGQEELSSQEQHRDSGATHQPDSRADVTDAATPSHSQNVAPAPLAAVPAGGKGAGVSVGGYSPGLQQTNDTYDEGLDRQLQQLEQGSRATAFNFASASLIGAPERASTTTVAGALGTKRLRSSCSGEQLSPHQQNGGTPSQKTGKSGSSSSSINTAGRRATLLRAGSGSTSLGAPPLPLSAGGVLRGPNNNNNIAGNTGEESQEVYFQF